MNKLKVYRNNMKNDTLCEWCNRFEDKVYATNYTDVNVNRKVVPRYICQDCIDLQRKQEIERTK